MHDFYKNNFEYNNEVVLWVNFLSSTIYTFISLTSTFLFFYFSI